MMTNTFCHLPGIGEKTERRLWTSGLTSWQDVASRTSGNLPRKWRPAWDQHIEQSLQHYQRRNLHYFAKRLPSNQQWRLYHDFHQSCAFVDIETTGLDRFANEITTIVLYDGKTIRWYVNGQNLEEFGKDIHRCPSQSPARRSTTCWPTSTNQLSNQECSRSCQPSDKRCLPSATKWVRGGELPLHVAKKRESDQRDHYGNR